MHDVAGETREYRDDSPGHENARDPHACADPVQQQVAWDFKDKIADEKNAGEQAELLRADAEILIHGQGGETYIDPVQISHEEQKEDERKNGPAHLADSGSFEIRPGEC